MKSNLDCYSYKNFWFSFQRAASNESQLALSNVSLPTAGKYSCEVSADAPSFHTLIVAGDLEVVGKWKTIFNYFSIIQRKMAPKKTIAFILCLIWRGAPVPSFVVRHYFMSTLRSFFLLSVLLATTDDNLAIFFVCHHLRNSDKHNFAAFCCCWKLLKICGNVENSFIAPRFRQLYGENSVAFLRSLLLNFLWICTDIRFAWAT